MLHLCCAGWLAPPGGRLVAADERGGTARKDNPGRRGGLPVARSDDRGEAWGPQAALTQGQAWHQSACKVWHAKGHVHLVRERRVGTASKAGPVGSLAPVLLRAREGADLTRRARAGPAASELGY